MKLLKLIFITFFIIAFISCTDYKPNENEITKRRLLNVNTNVNVNVNIENNITIIDSYSINYQKSQEASLTIIHSLSNDYQKSQQIKKKIIKTKIIKTKSIKKKKTAPISQKKQKFKDLLVPAINKVYAELNGQYIDLKYNIENNISSKNLKNLIKSYKAESNVDLLKRIKPHPKSIALAQAAIESSWATSRFFVKAKNVFGVWSFNKNEPRIAASQTRGNKTIWIKKYASVEESVRDYYKVLAKGYAYDEFRTLKMQSINPYELVKKLQKYSEKGSDYGKMLTSIIKYNKFYEYDK